MGPKHMKKFLLTVLNAEDSTIRIMGFIIIVLGLIVLFMAKSL